MLLVGVAARRWATTRGGAQIRLGEPSAAPALMGEQDRWKEASSRLARSFTAITVIGCSCHQSNVWPRGWQEHTKQHGRGSARWGDGWASEAEKSCIVCVADLEACSS